VARAEKIYIVGVGEDGLDGLTERARNLVLAADLLVGAENPLSLVPPGPAQRVFVGDDLDRAVQAIRAAEGQKILVLASGDPLFYGLARYLCAKLGKDRFEVVPHVSSMQLAFARVKESWEEAYLTNLATRPLETVIERIRTAEKVGLFPTEEIPPKDVAQALLDRGIDYFYGYVCENLGAPDERVTQGELRELAQMDFAHLNCLILIRKPDAPDRPNAMLGQRLFGNPDEAFLQTKPKRNLLTPAEVRALALAELDLGPSSTVWDIGAGSGSVAIEASRIASAGTTYAIEMDQEDHGLILANAEKFATTNLVPILGRAPEVWKELPDPDCIFLGGLGGEVSRLAELAFPRLRPGGRLVANVGAIENLAELNAALHRHTSEVKVWMLNLSRGVSQLERIRFEAMNPTFLVAAVKAAGK